MEWHKDIAEWTEDNTAFVSVPFTWLLSRAYQRCVWLKAEGYNVRAGGPAVMLRPNILSEVAQIGGEVDALPHHNPNATFTSRGCIRDCPFCAVPIVEGELAELTDWEPKPIVCDNNLLACSRRHFDRVIDRLKGVQGVDFNQGLDARLLTSYQAERLAELDLSMARLAWDHIDDEGRVVEAIDKLTAADIPKGSIRVYVLLGYDDSPDDALYRLMRLRELGVWPNAMRYQPLYAEYKNRYVAPGWTEVELRRFMKYWNRQTWYSHIPFEEFAVRGISLTGCRDRHLGEGSEEAEAPF